MFTLKYNNSNNGEKYVCIDKRVFININRSLSLFIINIIIIIYAFSSFPPQR